MPAFLEPLLISVYGETAARPLLPQIGRLIEHWRPRLATLPAARARAPLGERDVVLITYADQIRESGVAPLRTLSEFAACHLRGVVQGIHLLPFYPWSSDDGFSVKDYRAVDPACGEWEDVARIGREFDLMLDAVFNHLSAGSRWFEQFLADDPEFEDFFVTVEGEPDLSRVVRPRALPLITEFEGASARHRVWTTFSADQVDLNFRNPKVLLAVLDVLLFYVSQGARYVRLDAIAFLWKEIGTSCIHRPETHAIIRCFHSVLADVAPGVRLITETNVPHADNIAYFGDGTDEADLVYNFALPPLVLHSLATGDASDLSRWAASLRLPEGDVTFFNFLASHDGIGLNPARGLLSDGAIGALVDRTMRHGGLISLKHLPDGSTAPYEMNINYFDALSDPGGREPLELQIRRHHCAHAIQLSLAGVPGIYVHSLLGSRGDRAAADATGIARRINRERLVRAPLEAALADPENLRYRVFRAMCGLITERGRRPAFAPASSQVVRDLHPQVFAVERRCPRTGSAVLALHNVGVTPVTLEVPGLPQRVTLGAYEHFWMDHPDSRVAPRAGG